MREGGAGVERWEVQVKHGKQAWKVRGVKLLRHRHVIPFIIYFIFDYLCHDVMLLISRTLSYRSTSVCGNTLRCKSLRYFYLLYLTDIP